MGTISIYDNTTGTSYLVTIEVAANVVAGSKDGSQRFYITMATAAKNPDGGTIPVRIIRDTEFTDDITTVIKANLIEIFKDIVGRPGEYLSSSSSSSTMVSSISSGKTSSSSSSRLGGTSSSSSESSVSSQTP
jgi:hypothetical protein